MMGGGWAIHLALGAGWRIMKKHGQRHGFSLEPLEERALLAGLTLITHGAQLDGTRPSWLDVWGNQLALQFENAGIESSRLDLKLLQDGSAVLSQPEVGIGETS